MTLHHLQNVTTLDLNTETCIGCGRCVEVCPHRVLSLSDGKARIEYKDLCMECGACSRNCPVDAITVSAGVGCAYAIIKGVLKGTEPDCGCGCE